MDSSWGSYWKLGETPEEAILREVRGEVSCSFIFYPEYISINDVKIIKPFSIQIEKVFYHNCHINVYRYLKKSKVNFPFGLEIIF